jgi:hypothetical protein
MGCGDPAGRGNLSVAGGKSEDHQRYPWPGVMVDEAAPELERLRAHAACEGSSASPKYSAGRRNAMANRHIL